MSLPLYTDHHVHGGIVDGLKRRGVDVLTAFLDGMSRASDEKVLARCTELGRILFTQDDDFLEIAARWQSEGKEFAGIVYAHQLSMTVGQAVNDIELVLNGFEFEELRSRVLYLPLR